MGWLENAGVLQQERAARGLHQFVLSAAAGDREGPHLKTLSFAFRCEILGARCQSLLAILFANAIKVLSTYCFPDF